MTRLTRILHVEDDPDISDVVRLSLTLLGGFELDQYLSGSDAVRDAPGLTADLLLLDVMMPGLNGLETLEHLRRFPHFALTPALLFTAKTIDLPDAETSGQLGIIGTIRKPFGAAQLPARIEEIWTEFGRGEEGRSTAAA